MSEPPRPSDITSLGSDLTESILSLLPIPSIVVASSVCKFWRSVITSPSFSSLVFEKPWFFLFGLNSIFSKNNQVFAFHPDSNSWIRLRLPASLSHQESLTGSNGFFFTTTLSTSSTNFSYAPILKGAWRHTSPLKYSRYNPLVGVFKDSSGSPRFIVVGGARFIGGLADIEDRLAVEIYDPRFDSWELCPPLPADFRSGNSSQWLSSALFRGKFYVFGIYSCFVSAFDLNKHYWSEVQTLRPPGVLFSFLIACRDMLVLGGLCKSSRGGPSFNLWKVDEKSMEFREIAIMPQGLLNCLFDSDRDDKFASLKCVGLGNLIYVFNEEHHKLYHKLYPACVCEVSSESGKCSWRRVPHLPSPVNQFHKIIRFCSTVSLDNIFGTEQDRT